MWKNYKFIICAFCIVMFGDGSLSGHIGVRTHADDNNANNDEDPYLVDRRNDDNASEEETYDRTDEEEEERQKYDERKLDDLKQRMDGMYHGGLEQNYDKENREKMAVENPDVESKPYEPPEENVNALKRLMQQNKNKAQKYPYGYGPKTDKADKNGINVDKDEVKEELLKKILALADIINKIKGNSEANTKKVSRGIDENEMAELDKLTRFFERQMQE